MDESYTLAAWVSVGQPTGRWRGVVTKGRDSGTYYGLWVTPDGRFAAAAGGGNLIGPVAPPGWHHLALVQDGPAKQRTLYVDGSATVTGPAQPGDGWGPMVFGNVRSGNEPFDGLLDDVRLYGRAVPADQVRAMFASPRAVRVPSPAEVGGLAVGSASTVPLPLPGRLSRHAERRLSWNIAALPSPPIVGDTIDVWAEAADANNVTGPGVAVSEHRHLRVVDEAEKRRELMGKLGDYLGKVKDVSDQQRDLTAEVGTMVGPTTRPAAGKKN